MERQFIIVNKNNEELSFNSTDIFGHTPEGLGVEFEATTYQAYNSFNDMVLTVKQNEISLKLTLGNDSQKPYAAYMKLLKFLNVGNLILRYVVPDVGTFERKIALRSLSKKDMDLYSVLQEDIKFSAMSPWYSWVPLSKNFDRVLNSGRIWDDSRIYQTKYAYSWSNTGLAGTIYSAYSWSSDGKDRFTTIFPNLSILNDTRDYLKIPNVNETYYKRNIISSGGVNNSKYIQQSNTNPSASYKDISWPLPLNSIKTNTRYTLSFYARGSGKVETYIYPTFLDTTANSGLADNVQITPANDGKYGWTLTDQWVKHTYTFNSLASVTANQNFLFRLESGNSVDICLPKIEEGSVATEWMPTSDEVSDGDYPSYLGSARVDNTKTSPNFNLLKGTRAPISVTGKNETNQREFLYWFDNGKNVQNQDLSVGDTITCKFDWTVTNPTSGSFLLQLNEFNWLYLSKTISITRENKSGHSEFSFVVDSSFLSGIANGVHLRGDNIPTDSVITISNFLFTKGSTATEWMPAASETTVTDTMQPTEYNAYVWLPTNIQSGKDPVVYRGDFTREFPRLNLLQGTRNFKPIAAGNNSPNQNAGNIYFTQYKTVADLFKAGDYITISYDIEFLNTELYSNSDNVHTTIQMFGGAYTWLSFIQIKNVDGKFYTKDAFKNSDYVENPAHKLKVSKTTQLTKDFIKENATVNNVQLLYNNIPLGANVKITNLKIEQVNNLNSGKTPWMPSSEEVTIDDYPLFLGKYEGLGSPDLDDPLMYSWKQYGYQLAVDQNMVVEPDFSIDPPLLANNESKKLGTNWQVFNTSTNVGSTVTKTADGLKLVNTGNNTLYLRPNKPITLNGNNVYRLEYDVTVSSVQQNNDIYIVFTNQYQIPSYTDPVSVDTPYIKIPLTGEVTTNKDVTFNPISVHNMVDNTKTHRVIDITVPFGYNYVIIQAVNGSQSATTYNNFKLSYPIDTINHPANGPYSIISPKTNVYQVDYSRASSYLEIENDSMYFGTQEDSSLRIVIKATPTTGNIKNPSWYLADANGNKLQTEGFLTGIPVGYELVVSSDPFERLMVLRDSSGKLPDTEIDTFIDPMSTGWIRVPLGESRLILSDSLYSATGGFNAGSVSLEYKKEWVIV
ncbi:hypothetical protein P162_0019 [Lactococcus phage P162]|uniref:Distal tail protein N-terminal domain-containing protein n=1 Tax=Lactococcus phage P162 TaxID=1476889 RepID=X4Y899_9CAUD|nr:tail protein [Lactococcus phage P162]AHV83216.1 hypothetical protein P162_0019 [Lactococcus phage P162]